MKSFKKTIISILVAIMFVIPSISFTSEAASGTWKQSGGRWWYQYSDGSYAHSEYIDGYWLDSAGWYDASWNGSWKHNSKGWWFQSGSWYPASQWLKIDGSWYYFKSSGYMACNEWIGDYYVGSDGAWVSGKKKDSSSSSSTACSHNWVWATKTVHHDAVTKLDGPFREEYDVPVYRNVVQCLGCGKQYDTVSEWEKNDPHGGYTTTQIIDHYETRYDDNVYKTVVVKEAYDETVNDYQYCSKCGARK